MESIISLRNRYADQVAYHLSRYAYSRKWDISGTRVYSDGYQIKVDFGAKKYLVYVDQGTKPFLMYSLEGKTIPIGGSFRKVKGVGLPGIVEFERNGVIVRKMRWQKWRHPGIQPQNFVEQAFKAADKDLGTSILRLRAAHSANLALTSLLDVTKGLLWR